MPSEQEEFEFRARAEREAGVETSPKRRTPMEMVGRQIGLTARAGIEGAASLPLAITDAPNRAARAFGYKGGPTASEALHSGLTKIGLPEPEGATERIVQDVAGGMAGTAGVGAIAKGGIRLADILSGGGATGAAGGAREAGAPEWAQSLAGAATLARPGMLGLKPPATSIRNPANAVRLNTFNEANQAGYKFPPSQIERGVTRETLESMGGKAALNQETSMHNQQITNKLAKEGASLKPEQDLTEANLAQARNDLAEPYRKVAAVSPEAEKALTTWKDANAQAKLHWNDYQRNQTAAAYKQYEKFDARAETAQAQMEAEAVRTGNPQLVKELREARVKIAQNWDVDKALNIGSGDVRADVLGRMLNKRGEKGMSGPLGTIAKTQQAFPQFMKETAKTPTPGVSKLEAYTALGGAALGYESGLGLKGAAIGIAAPFASRGARALSMSNNLQRPLQQQGIPLSALTNFLANRNER